MSRQNKHTEEADAYDQAADGAGTTDAAELFRDMAAGERVEAERARRGEGRNTPQG